jgi:hypothetical protein
LKWSVGFRVAQRPRQHLEVAGERAVVREFALLGGFLGQHGQRRNPHDRAFNRVPKLVVAKNDVERLVPRHFVQRNVNRALHRLVDDNIQTTNVRERSQYGSEIRTLEIKRDRMACEPRGRGARRPRLHRRQLRNRALLADLAKRTTSHTTRT